MASTLARKLVQHFKSHVGVGFICAVAYFDPGNWSVDLQAGADFGYRPMLFVILLAGLGAMVLQSLACKLGCVTGTDLASHCRLLLHDHPKYPRLVRWMCLYPLYVLAEVAIISTDLAELLGSAIGFCLIFPSLPLWAGVILTACDVFVFLLISDPTAQRGRPARLFELVIACLVFVVLGCFVALLVRIRPHWPSVFMGFIPSKALFETKPDAVYAAVGILGATVMPHALFLGSYLATQNRLPSSSAIIADHQLRRVTLGQRLKRFFTADDPSVTSYGASYANRENNSLSFIQKHLKHGIVDIVLSLLTLAVPINSAILIVAATAFSSISMHPETPGNDTGLFEAHALIKANVGKGPAFIFALALICTGQLASITATLAGQVVSEGFIQWKIPPFFRRVLTRLISLVPAVVVAVAVGRGGINTLLVVSQVILAVVLPFLAFPLIYFTSSKFVMRVRRPTAESTSATPPHSPPSKVESLPCDHATLAPNTELLPHFINYSNGAILLVVSCAIGLVVAAADVYALAMLGLGRAY